jgi:hypothetical protein
VNEVKAVPPFSKAPITALRRGMSIASSQNDAARIAERKEDRHSSPCDLPLRGRSKNASRRPCGRGPPGLTASFDIAGVAS